MGSQNYKTKVALSANNTFNSSDKIFPFTNCDVSKLIETITTDHARGTRGRWDVDDADGNIVVAGPWGLQPSPEELDYLWPLILGGSETDDAFPMAETLPSFWMLVERVAKVHQYNSLKVNRATFSGSTGGKVDLLLDLVGISESEGNAGTFVTGISYSEQRPYLFKEGVININSTPIHFSQFTLVIDNFCVPNYNESQEAQEIDETDREVTLSINVPYVAATTGLVGVSGHDASLVFTNGNLSTTIAMASLRQDGHRKPAVGARGEIRQILGYKVRRTSDTAELVITHDSAA